MISHRQRQRFANFSEAYYDYYPGKSARYVTFIVTHQCNLRCSYCYEHAKSDKTMTLETAKKCVDFLFDSDAQNSHFINEQDMNGIILDFIGGEPLLEISLIDQIATYFLDEAIRRNHRWATRYMLTMSSNGMLYHTKEVQSFLNKFYGRVNISITVDGDKETHDRCRLDCGGCGSYDRASAAFKDAKERFGQVGTKFTVAPGNVDRVFLACTDIIERFNLSSMHCNCVYEEGWTEELAGVFYHQLRQLADWVIENERCDNLLLSIFDSYIGERLEPTETQNWCGGTGKMLAFDVDGTIYPCIRYAPLSVGNREPLRIGDIESGIGKLQGDVDTVNLLESITRQSQSTEECINCPIGSGCGWCSAYNYEVHGTPNKRATFICATHKARVLATSYYYNRIYRHKGSTDRFPVNTPREWAIPIIGEEEYDMLVNLASD